MDGRMYVESTPVILPAKRYAAISTLLHYISCQAELHTLATVPRQTDTADVFPFWPFDSHLDFPHAISAWTPDDR